MQSQIRIYVGELIPGLAALRNKPALFNIDVLKGKKAREFNYPFLVKEHFGNQSKGLHFIANESELDNLHSLLVKDDVTNVSMQEFPKSLSSI